MRPAWSTSTTAASARFAPLLVRVRSLTSKKMGHRPTGTPAGWRASTLNLLDRKVVDERRELLPAEEVEGVLAGGELADRLDLVKPRRNLHPAALELRANGEP